MIKMTVGYRTGSGNLLTLEVLGQEFDRLDIPLFGPKEELHRLCANCKGFSGGCPPYAPYFTDIKPSYPWLYVIVVRLDMAWTMEYASKTDNRYFKSSYADRLTDSYIKRITRVLTDYILIGFPLYCGGCHICKSRGGCNVLQGLLCKSPHLRTYSIEATGVDCSTLNEMIFGERMPYWYYGLPVPQRMTRYSGVLVNDLGGIDAALKNVCVEDKSFDPEIKALPKHRLVKYVAPVHTVDAGMEFLAYEDDR